MNKLLSLSALSIVILAVGCTEQNLKTQKQVWNTK